VLVTNKQNVIFRFMTSSNFFSNHSFFLPFTYVLLQQHKVLLSKCNYVDLLAGMCKRKLEAVKFL